MQLIERKSNINVQGKLPKCNDHCMKTYCTVHVQYCENSTWEDCSRSHFQQLFLMEGLQGEWYLIDFQPHNHHMFYISIFYYCIINAWIGPYMVMGFSNIHSAVYTGSVRIKVRRTLSKAC